MGRVIVPTNKPWSRGRFDQGCRETSASRVTLTEEDGLYSQYGIYTSGVQDLGSGADTRLVDITRPALDPGSIDATDQITGVQILHRASNTAPSFGKVEDDFKGYGLNTDIWTIYRNTNATITQTSGYCRLQVGSTDGDELWLKHNMAAANPDSPYREFTVRMRINNFPNTGSGEHLVGLYYGTTSPGGDLFVEGVYENRIMLQYQSSTGLIVHANYGAPGSTTYNIGVPPDEIEFLFGIPGLAVSGAQRSGFRTGSQYIPMETGNLDHVGYSFYVVLYNRTANGNSLSVDLLELRNNGIINQSDPQDGRIAWSPGMLAEGDDDYWADIEFSEQFDQYTHSLDLNPSSAGVWENWPEGMVESTGSEHLFGTQPQTYQSVDTTGWNRVYSAPGYKYIWLRAPNTNTYRRAAYHHRWIVGQGILRPMERFTFQVGMGVNSPSSANTNEWPTAVGFIDADGNYITVVYLYYMGSNTWEWYYWNGQGVSAFGSPDNTFTWTPGSGYFNIFMAIGVDITQGRMWFYNNEGGANRWPGMANSRDFGTSVYAGNEGFPLASTKPMTEVRLFHLRFTADQTMEVVWRRPTLLKGLNSTGKGTLPGTYFNENIIPWTYVNEGTNQASYYQTGRYSQFRVLMEGE